MRNRMNDALLAVLESCRYWAGIAECDCGSEYPIGGCLKCDMDEAVRVLSLATATLVAQANVKGETSDEVDL